MRGRVPSSASGGASAKPSPSTGTVLGPPRPPSSHIPSSKLNTNIVSSAPEVVKRTTDVAGATRPKRPVHPAQPASRPRCKPQLDVRRPLDGKHLESSPSSPSSGTKRVIPARPASRATALKADASATFTSVLIGDIPPGATGSDIMSAFSVFGRISTVTLDPSPPQPATSPLVSPEVPPPPPLLPPLSPASLLSPGPHTALRTGAVRFHRHESAAAAVAAGAVRVFHGLGISASNEHSVVGVNSVSVYAHKRYRDAEQLRFKATTPRLPTAALRAVPSPALLIASTPLERLDLAATASSVIDIQRGADTVDACLSRLAALTTAVCEEFSEFVATQFVCALRAAQHAFTSVARRTMRVRCVLLDKLCEELSSSSSLLRTCAAMCASPSLSHRSIVNSVSPVLLLATASLLYPLPVMLCAANGAYDAVRRSLADSTAISDGVVCNAKCELTGPSRCLAGVVQPVSVMCVDEHGNPLRGLAPDNVCIRITLHDRSNTAHHVTVTAGCVTVNNGKLSFEYTVEKRLVVSMKVPLTLDIEVVVLGVTAVRANIPVGSLIRGECVGTITFPKGWNKGVAISTDGSLLAISHSFDRCVSLLSLSTGALLTTIGSGLFVYPSRVCFVPSSGSLLVADGKARCVWEMSTDGAQLRTFPIPLQEDVGVACDGRLVAVTHSRLAMVFDYASGALLYTFNRPSPAPITAHVSLQSSIGPPADTRAPRPERINPTTGRRLATTVDPHDLPIHLRPRIGRKPGEVLADGKPSNGGIGLQTSAPELAPVTPPTSDVPAASLLIGSHHMSGSAAGGTVSPTHTDSFPSDNISTEWGSDGEPFLFGAVGVRLSPDGSGDLLIVESYARRVTVFGCTGVFKCAVGGPGCPFQLPVDADYTAAGDICVCDGGRDGRATLFVFPPNGGQVPLAVFHWVLGIDFRDAQAAAMCVHEDNVYILDGNHGRVKVYC